MLGQEADIVCFGKRNPLETIETLAAGLFVSRILFKRCMGCSLVRSGGSISHVVNFWAGAFPSHVATWLGDQVGRHLRTAESHPAVWRETDSGGSEQGKQGISWWSRRDRDFSRRVSLRHLSTPEKERMEERIVSVPLPLLMAVSTTAQKRADISNPCENVSKNKVPTGPRNQTQL